MIKDKALSFFSHPYISLRYRIKRLKTNLLKPLFRLYYGKNIILMESHVPFSGNSGALFNYLKQHKKYKKFTFVWLLRTYDGSIRNKRRTLIFSLMHSSPRKQWLIDHALYSFFDDVPVKPGGVNAKTIYLTHGCPPIKNVKGIINIPSFVDVAISSSKYTARIASEQYSFPIEKFIIAGQPRNDTLFLPKKNVSSLFEPEKYKKIILWLPTFRKAKSQNRNDTKKNLPLGIPLFLNKNEVDKINNVLSRENVLLVIKNHPAQDESVITIQNKSNFIILSNEQVIKAGLNTNDLFLHSDALISDYSSTVFDYLLIDKPVAFLFDDFDEYKLGLVDGYEELLAGCIMRDINDFESFILKVVNEEDDYAEKRKTVKNLVHEYQDGGYTKRIVELFNL